MLRDVIRQTQRSARTANAATMESQTDYLQFGLCEMNANN